MKTLKQWRDEVYQNIDNPNQLSALGVEMSADYAYYKEQYAVLKIVFAKFSDQMKFINPTGKMLSDASVENKWIMTKKGQQYTHIKYYTEGLKQMNRAIESRIVVLSLEAKNRV
jgi:hypothetical protein